MKKILIPLLKILVPPIIGISFILAVGFSMDPDTRVKYWYLCLAYFFPPLGKESVIPAGIFGGDIYVPILNLKAHITPIDPNVMAISIALIDSVVSLFVVWNYDLVKKIPILGMFIRKVEELGRKGSKKYAWIRPLKFIGIVLFVMVPLQGSGGLVGSILGRLIGMRSSTTWLAVTTGAFLGCFAIAYFTSLALSNVIIALALVSILVIVLIILKVWRESK